MLSVGSAGLASRDYPILAALQALTHSRRKSLISTCSKIHFWGSLRVNLGITHCSVISSQGVTAADINDFIYNMNVCT
jgi:hypothetical protein